MNIHSMPVALYNPALMCLFARRHSVTQYTHWGSSCSHEVWKWKLRVWIPRV